MSQLILNKLDDAVKDLLYQSESDEPFDVIHWKDESDTFDRHRIRDFVKCSTGTPIAQLSLEDFFKDLIENKSWYGQGEKSDVLKYRNLKEIISNELSYTQVFRVGQTEITILLIGKSGKDDWFGIRTKAIET
jgi:Nuclease A inhibitor-like protein